VPHGEPQIARKTCRRESLPSETARAIGRAPGETRRADDATRIALVVLSRLLEWRQILRVVRPQTLLRWHRKGFRLFWRWKSRPVGRPRIPPDVQRLVAQMAKANRTWGEERIAAELELKLGLRLSPRTIRRYMARRTQPNGRSRLQTWCTFIRNHASSVLACDFFVTVTASFRVLSEWVRHYNRGRPHASLGTGHPGSATGGERRRFTWPSVASRLPSGRDAGVGWPSP
jgi:hypothetical protein